MSNGVRILDTYSQLRNKYCKLLEFIKELSRNVDECVHAFDAQVLLQELGEEPTDE